MKIDTFLLGFALATVLQSSFLVIEATLNEDEWEWIEDDDNSKLAAVKKLMSKRIPPPPPDRSKLPVKDEVSTAEKTICDVENFMECAKQVAAAESTWQASPTNCDEFLTETLASKDFQSSSLIPVCRSYMRTNLCAEQANCQMKEVLEYVRLNNDTYPLKLITCYEKSHDVCRDQSLAPTPFAVCNCPRGRCCNDCFNDDATVLTEDGRTLKMTQLSVGDRVLTADPSTGEHYFDEVLTFLHRDVDNPFPKTFVYLSLADNAEVSLTPQHLIYVATKDELDDSLRNNQTTYGRPKFAVDVKPGDFVFRVSDSDDEHQSSREVLSVNLKFVYSGLYAPLTTSGNIVVDGVLMSCYAAVNSHSLAHFMWAPVRAFHKISALLPLSFDWFSTYTDEGINRYGDVLLNIASYIPFADSLFLASPYFSA